MSGIRPDRKAFLRRPNKNFLSFLLVQPIYKFAGIFATVSFYVELEFYIIVEVSANPRIKSPAKERKKLHGTFLDPKLRIFPNDFVLQKLRNYVEDSGGVYGIVKVQVVTFDCELSPNLPSGKVAKCSVYRDEEYKVVAEVEITNVDYAHVERFLQNDHC